MPSKKASSFSSGTRFFGRNVEPMYSRVTKWDSTEEYSWGSKIAFGWEHVQEVCKRAFNIGEEFLIMIEWTSTFSPPLDKIKSTFIPWCWSSKMDFPREEQSEDWKLAWKTMMVECFWKKIKINSGLLSSNKYNNCSKKYNKLKKSNWSSITLY